MSVQEPKPASTGQITIDQRLAWGLVSAIAMAIGSIGTWATAGPFSVTGTTSSGDGWITLGIAVALGVLVAGRRLPWLALPAALVAAGIGVGDAIHILSGNSDNEWFSVSLGWGLVLVIVASASLAAWGATAIRSTPRQQRVVAGVLTTLAIAGAIALSATDRTDNGSNTEARATASDDSSEPAGGNGSTDETEAGDAVEPVSEPEPADAEATTPSDDCDELGINGDVGNEGACTDSDGSKIRVVDRGTTLTLNELSVRDVSVNMTPEIPGEVDGPSYASGTYAQITVTVRNEGSAPLRIEPDLFRLVTNGKQYTTDFEAMNEPGDSCVWDSDEVQPGNERTCWLAFDVAKKNARSVTSGGNLYVIQPSDQYETEPKRRVGVIRLYK